MRIREAEGARRLRQPAAFRGAHRAAAAGHRGVGSSIPRRDGPAARAYWAHRNLFGGAERLRLEANVFYHDRGRPARRATGQVSTGRSRADVSASSFLKPASGERRTICWPTRLAERERTAGYTAALVPTSTAGIRHRFSDTFSIQGGIEYETRAVRRTSAGQIDYTLVGLPLSLNYDSTDNLLDPTHGRGFMRSVTPYPEFLGSTVADHDRQGHGLDLFLARRGGPLHARRPHRPRLESWARISTRSLPIPRFYAGGGGSVRGYRYQSLSPTLPRRMPDRRPEPAGRLHRGAHQDHRHHRHRALRRCRHGLRVRASRTSTTASASAAGLGLRYYTAIGPIRLDVATPINPGPGDPSYAIYVGIGQAF